MTDEEMAVDWIRSQGWNEETLPSDEFRQMFQAFLAGLEAGRPKWHKVADSDLPKESIPILILSSDNSIDECIYINGEGFKHPIFSNWYNPVAWIEKEEILYSLGLTN